jgi:acyl carrier protein
MNDSPADVILATLAQVAPEADLASLGPDAELRVELDIDSMDFLNFVVGIDERTGVDIPERDYPQLSTLNGCIEYLTRRMAEAPR